MTTAHLLIVIRFAICDDVAHRLYSMLVIIALKLELGRFIANVFVHIFVRTFVCVCVHRRMQHASL